MRSGCSGFGAKPSCSERERKCSPVELLLLLHDLLTFLEAVGLNPICVLKDKFHPR